MNKKCTFKTICDCNHPDDKDLVECDTYKLLNTKLKNILFGEEYEI